MKQLLYIGTWHHIKPVMHFPKTKKFIFIDTQPRSEHDEPDYFYEGFYRRRFIDGLLVKCHKYGFVLQNEKVLDSDYYKNVLTIRQFEQYQRQTNKSEIRLEFDTGQPCCINPTLLTFVNKKTKQKIKYYVSTNILYNMNDELERDIRESNGLIVSGYLPDGKLLEYFNKPKPFYGYSGTVYGHYPDEVDNRNNICNLIHTNRIDPSKYFSKFFLVNWKNGEMEECLGIDNIEDKRLQKIENRTI